MSSSIGSEQVVKNVSGVGTTEAGKQCSEPLRLPVRVLEWYLKLSANQQENVCAL